MAAKFWILHVFGAIIRCCLVYSGLSSLLKESTEVSTPMNSWKRVTEGVFLFENGIDPYSGFIFHETPIGLITFQYLINSLQSWLPLIFVFCDSITAIVLHQIGTQYTKDLLNKQNRDCKKYAGDVKPLLFSYINLSSLANNLTLMYLFNPFVIINCTAMTTTVFSNLLLALCLNYSVRGRRLGATWFLALSTYQSFYPIILIVPVSLFIIDKQFNGAVDYTRRSVWISMTSTFLFFIFWLSCLFLISFEITGNWKFISSIYGFLLLVPDLSPNIGLFWYFFTEMFEHFRLFFICIFQLNIFIYVLPLTIRLKDNPMLLYILLLSMSCVFKSYPSVGDVGFYFSLLPMIAHLAKYMRQTFLTSGIIIACSVLLPITRYLWLYCGSANSNFYFSITLAFATGQILMMADILFAYLNREFHLVKGLNILRDGKKAKIILN